MSNSYRIPFAAVLVLGTMALVLHAEVPNQSVGSLKKNSTHIVTGKVTKVTEISSKLGKGDLFIGNTDEIKGVCEITVTTCEKGEGIEIAKIVKARYEQSLWIGAGPSPPRSSGHRGIPKKGDTVRVYLLKAKDGGYDAAFPNGFEHIKPEEQ